MTTYATVLQLREYLKQVPASQDAALQTTLERAHEIVTDALGGMTFATYGVAATKDVYCAHRRHYLEIPYHEADSVTLVYELTARGESEEATDAETEFIEEDDGRLFLNGGWSPGWYRITAKWGYGAAPAHVVEVELEVAVNLWRGKDSGDSNSVGVEGQGGVTYSRAMTWKQRDMLDGVRLRYLGVVHA